MFILIVIAAVVVIVAASIVSAATKAKQQAADRAEQITLAHPEIATGGVESSREVQVEQPTVAEGEIGDLSGITLTVTDLSRWNTFNDAKIIGRRFPDQTVVATALRGTDLQTRSVVTRHFNRNTTIKDGDEGRSFDRCCVGLFRMAGVEAAIRLPRTMSYDTVGKVGRPAPMITCEAIITYVDQGGARTTRRISAIGFEPVGLRRSTDEVRIHAWCWHAKDYRTFNLSRIRSVMDPSTTRQLDKISWAWTWGGLKFPPSDQLRVS